MTRYEVIDHSGAVAYDAEYIAAMAKGYMTPRAYAESLAKSASDPEAPAPHRVRKAS